MPETYTAETFDASVIPTGFNKEARKTITLAVERGWKLLVTNRGHCTVIAPPPNEHININISQRRSDGPVRQVREKITRYGNEPTKIETTEKRVPQVEERSVRTEPKPRKRIEDMRFESTDEDLDLDAPAVTYEKPTAADRAARHIVRTGPMISRRGQRRGYVSEIANEREWSDGTIEFVCNVPGCDHGPDGGPYVTENRLSIGPHRKVHVNKGEVDATDQDRAPRVVIPPYEPTVTKEYHPRNDRLRSLSMALLAKLVSLGPDLTDHERADALAEAALAWSHERSGGGLSDAEREPLTDAQLLGRIRGLLDNGLYQRQADEIAAERAAREAAEARAEHEAAEAQRVKDDLSGMLDLLAEYREGVKS